MVAPTGTRWPDEVEAQTDRDRGQTDEQRFERLYVGHAALVRRVIRRYLWGAVVEDVVQEAFAQAYRSGLHRAGEIGDEPRVANTLAQIARSRSIDVLRRRMRGAEVIADDGRLLSAESTSPEADPEQCLLASRRREGIAEVLDALCERQRRVLTMKYVHGLSYQEIAAREGITLVAVKATLARGRRTFRHYYAMVSEREGLSVLVGGGLLARVRARLRGIRDRVATVANNAVGTVASVAPAAANTLATALVVGAVAVANGAALADEPSVAPAREASAGATDHAPEQSRSPDHAPGRAAEPEAPSEEAPLPSDDAAAPEPSVEPVSQETSTSVDTDEMVPDDNAPASASARTATRTGADPNEGRADTEQEGEDAVSTDGLEQAAAVGNTVSVGCFAEERGPVTGTVCPIFDAEEEPEQEEEHEQQEEGEQQEEEAPLDAASDGDGGPAN